MWLQLPRVAAARQLQPIALVKSTVGSVQDLDRTLCAFSRFPCKPSSSPRSFATGMGASSSSSIVAQAEPSPSSQFLFREDSFPERKLEIDFGLCEPRFLLAKLTFSFIS